MLRWLWFKTSFKVCFLLFLSGCDNSDSHMSGEEFLIHDQVQHEKVIETLEKEGIVYVIDPRGYVDYRAEDHAEVLGIIRSIKRPDGLKISNLESLRISNQQQMDFFVSRLNKFKIDYSINNINGVDYIVWSETLGTKVDLIKEEFLLQ